MIGEAKLHHGSILNRLTGFGQQEKRDTDMLASAPSAYLELAAGVGGRIKEVRQLLHATQKEMANRLGLSQSYVSSVERGEDKANIDLVVGLCLFFPELNPDWLLTSRGEIRRSKDTASLDENRFDLDIEALGVARHVFYTGLRHIEDEDWLVRRIGLADYTINRAYRTYMSHMAGLMGQGHSEADARASARQEAEQAAKRDDELRPADHA